MTFFFSHRPQISNFPLFLLFQCISRLFRENFSFSPTFPNSPLFQANSPAFYILYVYFPPYFDHDAFMHHPMHVLDAPDHKPIITFHSHSFCQKIITLSISQQNQQIVLGSQLKLSLLQQTIHVYAYCCLKTALFPRVLTLVGLQGSPSPKANDAFPLFQISLLFSQFFGVRETFSDFLPKKLLS